MSVVRDIFTNLAAQSVAFTTEGGIAVTPTALDLHQIKPRVDVADLPVRLVYPLGPYVAASGAEYVAMGRGTTVRWKLLDDMLWASALSGATIWSVLPDLVRYAGAYADMLADFRQPVAANGSSRTSLEEWDITPAVIQWGETQYLGVRATLTVQELRFAL